MNKDYSNKMQNLVNNLNSDSLSNKIKKLKHTINKGVIYDIETEYKENESLYLDLAKDSISTIADLKHYINWIKYD